MLPLKPPEGILDPQQPWYPVDRVGEKIWIILKAKLTGGEAFGTSYLSFVYLTNADADKLITNIKKYGKYPQVNQTGGAGGYENLEKYYEWLVEEFLEKPFRKQVDDKIEEASIASRMKDIEAERQKSKEDKAKSFISKSTSFRPGKRINAKVSKVSGLIPKRAIPQKLVDAISKSEEQSENTADKIGAPQRVVTSLGRLTLDLVNVTDNLDKIRDVIENDYKNTRQLNKKEVDEYRKRVANRGRILGRRELGNNKNDLSGLIKKYVGGFFSGVGGSIRGLSMINLLQAMMTGNPGAMIGPLLGIGASYLPAIGIGLGGLIAKSLLGGLFGAGKGADGGGSGGRVPRNSAGGFGKFGKFAALATAGLSLASVASNMNKKDSSEERLEDLTEEQKSALDPKNLVPIPQDDLKKFERLNLKFEKALDFLMKGVSDNNTNNTTTTNNNTNNNTLDPDPNLNPVDIASSEKEQLLRLMHHEAGGEGEVGMAAVAKSVMNRASLIQSGSVPPSTFSSSSGSITDIIKAPGQYQPYREGKLNTALTNDQRQKALSAFNLATSSEDMKQRLRASGKTEDQIKLIMASTGFRAISAGNDNSANVNNVTLGGHIFNTAGNTELNSPRIPAISNMQVVPRSLPSGVNTPPSEARPSLTINPIAVNSNVNNSSTSGNNDTVPSFGTSYSENFLTMYSKLIYQIV